MCVKLAYADAPGGHPHGDVRGGLGCTPGLENDSRLLALKVLRGYKKSMGLVGDKEKGESEHDGVQMLDVGGAECGGVSLIICVSSVLFHHEEGRERGKT